MIKRRALQQKIKKKPTQLLIQYLFHYDHFKKGVPTFLTFPENLRKCCPNLPSACRSELPDKGIIRRMRVTTKHQMLSQLTKIDRYCFLRVPCLFQLLTFKLMNKKRLR